MTRNTTPRRFYIDHDASDAIVVRSVPYTRPNVTRARQRAAATHPSHAALLLSLGRLVRSGQLRNR